MKSYELIEYIKSNDKIVTVLEGIGCGNIKKYSKEYRFSTPICPNSTANRIKIETLKYKSFSGEGEKYGDIISLTMEINDIKFVKAIKLIHKILRLKYYGNNIVVTKKKKDILSIFKKAKNNYYNNNLDELKIYHEDIFREYVKIPYIEWIKEGIMPYTQKEFNVGYSLKNNRVCIPWKLWCGEENDYTGLIGRTLNKDYNLFNIPKYFPLISFPKSLNLFGLQENYKYIQEKGEVIVYEAEKSVLKSHSLFIKNTVALGGHELSDEQIKILVSLNVRIIFAMDNDMSEELSIKMCKRVQHLRKTGYIYDEFKLTGNKSSPIDKGLKVYNALYKRVKWIN
ncbi:toprim domain-containing protein [Clostridium botulinum]|uniref:toprim domain-containing protein n=1 Tax=Clostridium botulinum TaxID=1491 RepID=UPI001C9B6B26|nr:toprim domain-containing protein [Clostridium botulinum]MBY6838671.1 DNA primase [Clostridium botulinum]